MNKIKIFISSRVNSAFSKLDAPYTLEELRAYLRTSLEAEKFLGEPILQVIINESNFNSTISKNAFDNCIDTLQECNIIIILYNGQAGWSISGSESSNGICHEEFLVATREFSDMSFMLDLSAYFDPAKDPDEIEKNEAFARDIKESFSHMETIKAKKIAELKNGVLKQVKQYILKALEKSLSTQKTVVSRSTVFGDTLDWNKLNYTERKEILQQKLQETLEPLDVFQNVFKLYHGIPDNMSVADARNLIGRPFLQEHELIRGSTHDSGAIHFVAGYGNVTEAQAKGLVGYPDVTIIKASFGLYLWEKIMHIQIFFFKACVNPQTIKTRCTEMVNWLNSSRELSNIKARAKARYAILEVVNENQMD